MIRRQLLLVNMVVMIAIMSFIVLHSVQTLNKISYNDTVFIYDMYIKDDYEDMNNLLKEGQDYALTISANPVYQRLLANGLADETKMREITSPLLYDSRIGHADIIPVIDYDGYQLTDNGWVCLPEIMYDFDIKFGYKWTYRPNGLPIIRVSRLMRDETDINKVIAIVNVDIAIAEIEDRTYNYQSQLNNNAQVYLLDQDDHYLLHHYSKGYFEYDKDILENLGNASYYNQGNNLTIGQSLVNGWKLIMVVNKASLISNSNPSNLITISIGVMLIGIVISFLLTNKITEPILSLANNMKRTADKQQFDLLVNKKSKGEVKVLYDSYNYLIGEVNNSIVKAQESSKKEAEYQFRLLQAQINPHFLYNTLNIISFMAMENRNEDISKVIYSLVKLLRISLNNGRQYVTLKDEVSHVDAYLDIMHYRYPDRYKVEYKIAKETEDLYIVKQILQPLAENALNHGFLEHGNSGVITIVSKIEDRKLILEMHNTGTMIDLDYIKRLLANDPELTSKHYGIRNVNERLISRYGLQSGLNYYVEGNESIVSIAIDLKMLESSGDNYE